MGGLSAFMAQNAVKQEHMRIAVSPRFMEDGKPAEWEARALTTEENEALRKKFTRHVQVTGKPGQFRDEFDANGYLAAMAAACTVYPDLNDAELQDSYGALGAEALLKKMLLAGESTLYFAKVQELNGFTSFEEQVDEAKN